MARPQTLLESLTGPIPECLENFRLDGKTFKGRSHTKGRYGQARWLLKWKDLKLEAILEIFGDTLAEVLNARQDDLKNYNDPPKSKLFAAYDEKSITPLLDSTIISCVQQALERSSQLLLQQDVHLIPASKKVIILLYDDPKNARLDPDWGCKDEVQIHPPYDLQEAPFPTNNILPGDSKWEWKSSELKDVISPNGKVRELNALCLRPVRQVLTYCARAHSRYGFILTNRELVALRIRYHKDYHIDGMDDAGVQAATMENGVVEWTSIPWRLAQPSSNAEPGTQSAFESSSKTDPKSTSKSKSETRHMSPPWTMPLALYSLVILTAGTDGHLRCSKDPYPPLNEEPFIPPTNQRVLLPRRETPQEAEDGTKRSFDGGLASQDSGPRRDSHSQDGPPQSSQAGQSGYGLRSLTITTPSHSFTSVDSRGRKRRASVDVDQDDVAATDTPSKRRARGKAREQSSGSRARMTARSVSRAAARTSP